MKTFQPLFWLMCLVAGAATVRFFPGLAIALGILNAIVAVLLLGLLGIIGLGMLSERVYGPRQTEEPPQSQKAS